MLRTLFSCLFICVVNTAFSQNLGTFQKIEAGISGFTISLETPVAENLLFEGAIGLGPSYDMGGTFEGLTNKMDWGWILLESSFHASAYGKYFYNREKRARKGKSLKLNSGHFVGLKVKYVSKTLAYYPDYSNTLLFNLNWGGQHNLGKHWQWGYSLGIGYGYNLDEPYGLFYPAFDIKVAYILPFFSKQ